MDRNPEIPFTYEYSQPQEYHFSLDSIEMPWEVANHLKDRIRDREFDAKDLLSWKCLDLCAGTGVLGFEMNFHLPELTHWEFVEVQSVYQEHFQKNRKQAEERARALVPIKQKPFLQVVGNEKKIEKTAAEGKIQEPQFNFLNKNYSELLTGDFERKYELVLCNPPYFLPEQGKQSPSDFKNRCRFFIDSTFEKMVEVFIHILSEKGEAYLLLRDLDDHGKDLFMDLRTLTRGRLEITNLSMIRGTFLLKLTRLV